MNTFNNKLHYALYWPLFRICISLIDFFPVSKWVDGYNEAGATFYQARRKCQVCGGYLADKEEVEFYKTVSSALKLLEADTTEEAVLDESRNSFIYFDTCLSMANNFPIGSKTLLNF